MTQAKLTLELTPAEAAIVAAGLAGLRGTAKEQATDAATNGNVKGVVSALRAYGICTALLDRLEEGAALLMQEEEEEEEAVAG